MTQKKTVVALARCETYAREQIEEAVDRVFALCGGVESILKPGQRVLVKVNLLMKRAPEMATTTHPEVARAIIRAIKNAGATPILADSPGGPYTRSMLSGVYDACGMKQVAQETCCILNDDFSVTSHFFEQGVVSKRLDLIGLIDKVDAVISVGKLKTHGFTTMTGCVKNMYGLVPGTTKVEYHSRYPNAALFSDMLIDLCEHVKPCFGFIDGVVGMEGEGPSGGTPRQIGALIGGKDLHAVDSVAARLIGLRPQQVTTLEAAVRRKLLVDYDLAGDPIEPMIIPDFHVPMQLRRGSWVALMNRLPQQFRPRPVFTHKKCDGCGTCERACPAKAIEMKERRPFADINRCIRCYCCQELCPKNDIIIKRNPVFSMLK